MQECHKGIERKDNGWKVDINQTYMQWRVKEKENKLTDRDDDDACKTGGGEPLGGFVNFVHRITGEENFQKRLSASSARVVYVCICVCVCLCVYVKKGRLPVYLPFSLPSRGFFYHHYLSEADRGDKREKIEE